MTLQPGKKFFIFLLFSNLILGAFVLLGLMNKPLFKNLETQNLIIRNPNGGMIHLGFEKNVPVIQIFDQKNQEQFSIQGGEYPTLSLKNTKNQLLAQFGSSKDASSFIDLYHDGKRRFHAEGNSTSGLSLYSPQEKASCEWTSLSNGTSSLTFRDEKQTPRLQLEYKDSPGLFLKNSQSKTIASWTLLNDGCAGLGLADQDGNAASILRGGITPSLAFFSQKSTPIASMGIANSVPHLLISGNSGNEGILIHGGHSSGFMVVDEDGKLKIFISKKGVFQGKDESKEFEEEPKKEKLFSFETDSQTLFPDQNASKR